jgi:hypothetical protein
MAMTVLGTVVCFPGGISTSTSRSSCRKTSGRSYCLSAESVHDVVVRLAVELPRDYMNCEVELLHWSKFSQQRR